tara:strand:+ start:62 stop:466 length:405 start_codon:yes stop_codon:yes gene_type:complete
LKKNIIKETILIDIKKLKYTKDHEWVHIDNDIATIGVTDFAQSELGDIIFIEFPNQGDVFKQHESVGTLEAVKTVADIYSPVSGSIVEINSDLDSNPELINSDPYNDGWIVKIKIEDSSEIDGLLDLDSYTELI